MKKKAFVLFIVLILSAIFCCGCFADFFGDDDNDAPQTESVNYADIINEITLNVMKSNFKVVVSVKQGFNEIDFASGSGVVIKQWQIGENVERNYYLITNNHVIASGDYDKNIFHVEDYTGARIDADVIARSADYDLAVLKFTSVCDYGYVKLSNSTLNVDDAVFAIGTPEGQKNAITVGKFLGEATAQESSNENSKIKFNILKHSAKIKEGSSGGALLNSSLEIVGINYGGLSNEQGEYTASVSIPVKYVRQYLLNNNISV